MQIVIFGADENITAINIPLPTISGGGGGPTAWADITDKPATFPPATHTHAWSTVTGKPTTFPPADHSHAPADITGLQAAVEGWTVRTSDGVSRIVPITQAAYDALGTKVATTLYLITG